MDNAKIRQGLRLFLEGLAIDDTLFDPTLAVQAVADEWETEFLCGYQSDPRQILTAEMVSAPDQTVFMTDISYISFCVHHFLPFKGVVHLAYVPDQKITGLSRLVKLVRCYAQRLQIQERLTDEITDALMTHLKAKGAACLTTAEQFCVCARGVRENSRTVVTSFKGIFLTDDARRREFFDVCRLPKS